MSDTVRNAMLVQLTRYFNKVRSYLKPIVWLTPTITAGGTITYDLKTYFADHAKYDLRSCNVKVLLLNKETGSSTVNMYINSQASIVYGIDATGKVVITNFDTVALDLLVQIDPPTYKK